MAIQLMKQQQPRESSRHLAVVLSLLLAACGGESNSPAAGGGGTGSTPSTTLSGTVAVGAPVVGANISAKCKTGSYPVSGILTTGSNGAYTGLVVPNTAFPCAIRSSGGTVNSAPAPTLHSFSSSSSGTTANITPLTDLITALALNNGASQNDINTWFTSAAGSATLDQLASALSGAQSSLIDALIQKGNYGITLPTGFNPFISGIVPAIPPATNSDPYDNLLEALQAALADAGIDYDALLASFLADPTGTALPDTKEPEEPEEPEEPVEPGEGLGFTIHAITERTLIISFHGELSETEPAGSDRALVLHAPGNWISHTKTNGSLESVIQNTLVGTTTTYGVYATDAATSTVPTLGDHIYIPAHAGFTAGAAGSNKPIAIVFPENVFIRDAMTSLSLSWGRKTTAPAKLEVPQSNSPVTWGTPAGSSGVLGTQSGVTVLVDGSRHTTTTISSYIGPPLSIGTGYLTAGKTGDAFQASISGISSQVGVPVSCKSTGIPGVSLTLDSLPYSGSPDQGGTCIVTTTTLVDTDRVLVSFEGLLKRTVPSTTAPEYIQVSSGEFQYVVQLFPPGNGQALVSASFEGASIGSFYSNNPLPISTDDFGWKDAWKNVTTANVSSNPLQVTPAGGNLLNGGNVAVSSLGAHDLSSIFTGDVYVSFLLRWNTPTSGGLLTSQVATLSNAAVYVGVVNGEFVASIGDDTSQKFKAAGLSVSAGTTYHVVGRLHKSAGSNHYDRLSLWVNPGLNDQDNPLGTASRASAGTGSLRYVDQFGLSTTGHNNNPLPLADRIRLSDTWAGLFAD